MKPLNNFQKKVGVVFLIVLLFFLWLSIPLRSPLFDTTYSTIILAEDGSLLQAYTNPEEQWHFPPQEEVIPEKLKKAVLTFEDKRFDSHIGIDLLAILRAAKSNIQAGKVVSGASTLTMQVARLRHDHKRTLWYKISELFDALKIDWQYSKGEILKLYLDHAPFGGNVIGYHTASLKFFGKHPAQLTWSEAATLAVLPNAPGLIYPTQRNTSLIDKRNSLLLKLKEAGHLDEQAYILAKIEPIPTQFLTFESTIPHAGRWLKSQYPDSNILQTTIDKQLQQSSQYVAEKHRSILAPYGIYNLSILVADTRTGAIKAYVGSPAFFDAAHQGQVDGVQAARSSGSILKPLLYALSIDEGLILPNTLIRDLPTYFDGFSPNNANEDFQGVVTAKEALISSLNIPAVRLLNSYGVYQFYAFLKMAGVSTLFRDADAYGLPLILGGAEVNMWDMVMLYRGLANGGVFTPNNILQEDITEEGENLISKASTLLTLDMLKEVSRPGSEYYWQKYSRQQPIAWKTGTSYGHKDAWAIGVNPQYTIAVWVGNFTGESNKNLSGAASAGPILFDLLQSFPTDPTSSWFAINDIDFHPKAVCELSGLAAGEACMAVDTVSAPYNMKALRKCDYHQKRYFSEDGRYQTCSQCWSELGAVSEKVTYYPPDIAFYLRSKGQYIDDIKPHYPSCPSFQSDDAIRIIYPNPSARLFLPRDYNGQVEQVVCQVGHRDNTSKIYWYLNEQYIGNTQGTHKLAVTFQQGKNELKVIDENGSEDSRSIFAQLKQ
nr:penicillin-binding protein 1C [Penaeicola halotolerans]